MAFTPGVLTYPNTSGPRASFGHLEIKIAGFPAIGIASADYSRTRTVEYVYGAHPDPLGTTQGVNEYKLDVEMFEEELRVLCAVLVSAGKLAPGGPVGYGDLYFPVTATYNVPGFGTVTDTIQGNRLSAQDYTNAQGAGTLKRKVAFKPLKILFNGQDDVTNPLPQLQVFQSITSLAA